MKKYHYGIEVNQPLTDLYSISNTIEFIQDSLLLDLHKMQSSNQAMMNTYHRNLTKVILTFNLESKIVDQSRHFFPFIEKGFTAPYMLSNFNPSKEVTILDMILNQNLREKILQIRDLSLKNGKDYNFEFNKTTYRLNLIYDYLHLKEPIGFLLTIEAGSETLLDRVMEHRQSYGKTLRLRFQDSDRLAKRVKKSLKFLNKIYGVSSKRVE